MKLLILLSALFVQNATVATEATGAAKAWRDNQIEIEEFLRSGEIDRLEGVPIGKTGPRKVYFKPEGLLQSAIIKDIPPRETARHFDSYKSEIAAYELDKLLDLDMVPPTVRRYRRGKPYSVQLWIGEARSLTDVSGQPQPRPQDWLRDLHRQRLFDVLIANTDRNVGNIVVDPDWNMVLVDHSRSMSGTSKVPGIEKLARIDRPFFERVKSLEYETFWAQVGPWLRDTRCATALMARRDRIVKHFEALATEKGDLIVFSH